MKRWPLFVLALAVAPMSLVIPIAVRADTTIAPIQPSGNLTSAFSDKCANGVDTCHTEQTEIGKLFAKVFQIATLLAGILATLFVVYNGIQYILSAGDAAKMKTARSNILNILLGIIVIVAAYSIIRFAQLLGGFATSL